MVFLFNYMLVLPQKAGDDLIRVINEIEDKGFTQGKKVFLFQTRDAAEEFAKRILNLSGVQLMVDPVSALPNSDKYNMAPGQYAVSFIGYRQPEKQGETLDDFFQSVQETGKDVSRKSHITETKYSGDEPISLDGDGKFALDQSQPEVLYSQKSRGVMQQTMANLFLAYRNMPRNEGSMEELEYSVRATLTQLAVKMGFSGESAIIDFLKTPQGETFRDELEQASLEGKFYIGGSASSEWMSNQWVARKGRGIKYEFYDNALDRCQMALDFINGWLNEAGREKISAPFVPTVYLIVNPTESVRSNLIEAGVEKFSERCKDPEAIASVRKSLEEYYSDSRIAENRNRFGNYLYKLAQEGDAGAIDAWNRLTSGKNPAITYTVMEDKDGKKTVDCQIGSQSKADSLFSWNGGLRTKGGVLEEALSEGDSRSASFSLQSNITLGIEIVGKESQKFDAGKDAQIRLSVSQKFRESDGTERTGEFSGTIVAKAYDEAGSVTVCDIAPNKDGTYTASFKPEAGKTYSFIAYAFNSDERSKITIDSGRVKQAVNVEEEAPLEYWGAKTDVKNVGGRPGVFKGNNSEFLAYADVSPVNGNKVDYSKSRKEYVDVRLAFGLVLEGVIPQYFFAPGKDVEIEDALVGEVSGQNVVVDGRGIVAGGKTIFSAQQVEKMARENVAAFKHGGQWFTLDGRRQVRQDDLEKQGFKLSQDGSTFISPKKLYKEQEALSLSNGENELNVTEGMNLYLPNAITFSKENRDLAKQHIIATVKPEMKNGKKVDDFIYGLDGKFIGRYSEIRRKDASIKGLYVKVTKEEQQEKSIGDYWFEYPHYFPNMRKAGQDKYGTIRPFIITDVEGVMPGTPAGR